MSPSLPTKKLGEYRDTPYFIAVRADPDIHDPDDFSVSVYFNDTETKEKVEIARIDTAHGYTHFDKLYRRDQPKEEFDGDLWDAWDLLKENWRQYAKRYHQNH